MRLLNQSAGVRKLEESGIPPHLLLRLRHQLKRPHGMILVTGPTGSGKTTTLYGALNELNTSGKKSLLRKIRWNTGFHGSIRCK